MFVGRQAKEQLLLRRKTIGIVTRWILHSYTKNVVL